MTHRVESPADTANLRKSADPAKFLQLAQSRSGKNADKNSSSGSAAKSRQLELSEEKKIVQLPLSRNGKNSFRFLDRTVIRIITKI